MELKKPGVPARAAFDENLTHYKQQIPALSVPFSALLIASNGTDSRVGSLISSIGLASSDCFASRQIVRDRSNFWLASLLVSSRWTVMLRSAMHRQVPISDDVVHAPCAGAISNLRFAAE